MWRILSDIDKVYISSKKMIYAKHINASLGENVSKLPFCSSLAFIITALKENVRYGRTLSFHL